MFGSIDPLPAGAGSYKQSDNRDAPRGCPPHLPDTGNETDLSAWLGRSPLDTESLTDRQFWLAGWCAVKGYPRILKDRSETRVAVNLERLGWGAVEDGASGERIFRLGQADRSL